jgi:carotenoid 1,2-hydratase
MGVEPQITSTDKFAFSSSVRADVWHPQKDSKAYEWWYFDALSDDGKEAIVIVFLDNFIYSPRYNAHVESSSDASPRRFPAVSFTYFRDGKAVYRAVNEYSESDFSASRDVPECRIGDCSFKFETASYGSGYMITINAALSGDRRLHASLEWLSIESDFQPDSFQIGQSSHGWNMVAPRSDVSGRITVLDRKGKTKDERQFRGTGYHDHNLDNRWLAKTVRDWHWGRAHFADSTAVFYRYCEHGDHTPSTKLLVIKNGELRERTASYEEQNYVRDKFGIRYPTRLRLISEDNMRLRVKPIQVIDSSFYYLRFLSEITLTLRDGVPRKTTGITEFLAPKTLKYRWLNWISDMRTGKHGKGPLLP